MDKSLALSEMIPVHRQNGLALVMVMLVVAIVASIAAFMALGQQIWLRQTLNLQERTQARAIHLGGLAYATILLERDAAKNSVDHLNETWATGIKSFPLKQGRLILNIEDAQGRFNLNNLINKSNPSTVDVAVFRRLLAYYEIDGDLVDPLLDWIDGDDLTRPGGAEDVEYMSYQPPYRTGNKPMADVEELRLIKGFTPKIIARLRDLITVLPVRSAININTAPAPILGALFSSMSLTEAKTLADKIRKDPLASTGDLTKLAGTNHPAPTSSIAIHSDYFLVTVATQFGQYRNQSHALVLRPAKSQPSSIIRHSRMPIPIAEPDRSE